MGKKGYFPQGIGALSHTQAQMQVMQGKSAMASTGSWVGNEMKEATPDGFEWGYMAVPFTNDPNATVWIQHGAIAGELIWANKPDLNKKWAKEFLVWLWNMDVQEILADKGGVLPARKDFADDPARANKLQAAPKAFLDYVNKHNVRYENAFREVTLTDQAFTQATKLFSESVTQITEGKKDPLPVLKEADSLLQKAWDNQK
jgi:N-acetylglucosamine transport system substrate-binding protein